MAYVYVHVILSVCMRCLRGRVEASKECGMVTRGIAKTGLSRQTVASGCLALSPFQYSFQWEGRTRLYQFTSRDSGTDQRNIWM